MVKASKGATEAKRIPQSLEGLKGFGHGIRWPGMKGYYTRKRRTRQEIEQEGGRPRIFTQDVCKAFKKLNLTPKSHSRVEILSDSSIGQTVPVKDISTRELSLAVPSNSGLVEPPTYMAPLMFEHSLPRSDPSGPSTSTVYPSCLEELFDMNAFLAYTPAYQEGEGTYFDGDHDRHNDFDDITSFPGGYEGQAVPSVSIAYSSNFPYNHFVAQCSASTFPTTNGHFGYEYTPAPHGQTDTSCIPIQVTSTVFGNGEGFFQ